jgi:transposase
VVNLGQALKAMILNGLGFVSAPLYLFEQFFVGKATEHLIGEGVQPEHLNDDRLGRALDKFHDYGVTRLFTAMAMKAAQQYGVGIESVHLDSSSFAVEGQYLVEPPAAGVGDATTGNDQELGVIQITYGYSRDRRPDLKQFLMDTICSADGDVPLYLRLGNGNEADKAVFVQVMQQYQQQWRFEGLFVVDSSLYAAENLQQLGQLRWLTRVPLTLKQAKLALHEVAEDDWMDSGLVGYRLVERCSHYAQVEQRWFIVESQQRRNCDIEQLQKRLDKQTTEQQVKLDSLCAQSFACEADAREALEKFERSLRWHQLAAVQVVTQPHYGKGGRPRKDQTPAHLTYHLQATLVVNSSVIEAERQVAGRFILATNVLEVEQLNAQQALQEYKDQQSAERGFRFLKDPLFFTSSVFLKSAKRIMALAMVMGLCLLVYNLAQRKLRKALQAAKTGIKNQLGKLTNRPTVRWVFQCFQAVHLVTLNGIKQVSNLTQERQQILQFLGSACGRYYLLC